MAGGITNLGAFSAGTPLDVVSGGGSVAGLGAMAVANPYLAAAQFVISLMSGQNVKISSAGANGQAQGGFADFNNDDVIGIKKNVFDLSDPKSVAIIAVVIVGAIYAIKKLKRFK
ncbi:MAG: hypothetical protein PHO76_02585 [Methylotenera sp.]|nr:hypothetical protein [Methylotenera sp.]MDD4927230.1 hypothetical protein [Methylotenera sp.]